MTTAEEPNTDNPSPRRRLSGVSGQTEITTARSEKMSKAVARLIAREVAEKHLPPGSPLPPEQVMAEQYGVGRSSIREALRLLENQGLIVMRPGLGGGPIVGQSSAADFGKTMTMFLQIQGTKFSQVLDALPSLEGLCAALAAQRCATEGPQLFDEVVPPSALTTPTASMDDAQWMATSGSFHTSMLVLAGNDIISLATGAVAFIFSDRAKFDPHRQWNLRERKKVHSEHLQIAAAVKSGDVVRARQLTEDHYNSIQQNVRRSYPYLADQIIDWH
jgi:GntR family transcriptional regulator, transcriptional repressor for pyruvate dehydrogenase complex